MDYLQYGFDPEMLFERMRKPSAKKASMLKPIETKFTKPNVGEDPKGLQIIVDENAINSYLLEFVMIDQSLSVSEYFALDARTRPILTEMTTDNLGIVMPDILEEFGPGLKFDVMLSMSHTLMKDKVDSQRITGFNIDKNGNFRFTLNFYAQILVQDKNNKKGWLNAREVFLGLTLKGKAVIKEITPTDKALVLIAKTAEVSTCKILKNNGEEAVVEQMLITSGFNV